MKIIEKIITRNLNNNQNSSYFFLKDECGMEMKIKTNKGIFSIYLIATNDVRAYLKGNRVKTSDIRYLYQDDESLYRNIEINEKNFFKIIVEFNEKEYQIEGEILNLREIEEYSEKDIIEILKDIYFKQVWYN